MIKKQTHPDSLHFSLCKSHVSFPRSLRCSFPVSFAGWKTGPGWSEKDAVPRFPNSHASLQFAKEFSSRRGHFSTSGGIWCRKIVPRPDDLLHFPRFDSSFFFLSSFPISTFRGFGAGNLWEMDFYRGRVQLLAWFSSLWLYFSQFFPISGTSVPQTSYVKVRNDGSFFVGNICKFTFSSRVLCDPIFLH